LKRAASFYVLALLALASTQGLLAAADVAVRGHVAASSGSLRTPAVRRSS
jgi:hypothetical protein